MGATKRRHADAANRKPDWQRPVRQTGKKLSGTFVWAELQVGEINRRLKAFPELQGEIGLNPEAAALIMQNIERYGSPDWWHWRVSHWGTKWNAQDCCISLSDGLLEVSFETA